MDLDRLNQGLIVSCQPVPGGPMDSAGMVAGFALSALAGGASAVRIEGQAHVAAVRAATDAPILGFVRRDLEDSPVRITPLLADVVGLAAAGADVIAFDATRRPRPTGVAGLVRAVHATGRLAMADCSDAADARAALAAGADIVSTALAGRVGGYEPDEPDLALIEELRRLSPYVIAEGRIRAPAQAREALCRGAWAVVVGSAITRPEHVTGLFVDALARGAHAA